MRGIAVLLALALSSFSAFAADIFASEKTGYSLIYSDDWQPETSPNPDAISLKCIAPICENKIHASISAVYDYRYANDTPEKIVNRFYPAHISNMINENSKAVGKLSEIETPSFTTIGNTQGFMGRYWLTYKNGLRRHMIYAVILNKGYFYHMQFLSPEEPNENIAPIAVAFFDGFQINSSE